MNTQSIVRLGDYIRAGYPAIVLNTSEEERALEECYKIAEGLELQFYAWSETKGVFKCERDKCDGNLKYETVKESVAPDEEALNEGLTYGKNTIYCMLDFHPYIKAPNVWRTAKDVFAKAKGKGTSYIFISCKFDVPAELEHEVIITSLDLPQKKELQEIVNQFCKMYGIRVPENLDEVLDAALGLTIAEATNAYATSLSNTEGFDVDIINNVKRQIICKDGLLEYMQPKETMETVGGMKNFTSYAENRLSAYSEEARAYGLPYPKGVLLVGIPGCGKSLAAKALSNMWKKPLLKLDLGKLFGSLVGDTEANTRKALEIAEAMAPAILWIDEIEKGLSGVGSSGKTDSGVTSRMFGTILTWLQEKETPVYVIATANNISSLPPEFLRKGRFDEIFFVDLPSGEEREEIFEIQLKKYGRKSEDFDIAELAKLSEGYTGAEIEEAIVSAMFNAWNDGKRPLTTDDIKTVMSEEIKPMSTGIMSGTVQALREWSSTHGIRSASSIPKVKKAATSTGNIKSTRQIRFKKQTNGKAGGTEQTNKEES